MKNLPIVVIVALWAIAIVSTLAVVKDTGAFTFLGPVYFVCMLGSVVTVRNAMGKTRG
jgi:hypothetical protein